MSGFNPSLAVNSPGGLTIRKAQVSDLKQIHLLSRLLFPESLLWNCPFLFLRSRYKSQLQFRDLVMYVIQLKEVVVGFALIINNESEYNRKFNNKTIYYLLTIIMKPWLLYHAVLLKHHNSQSSKNAQETIVTNCFPEMTMDNRSWIELIAVLPDCQNKGVGSILMDHIISESKKINKQYIELLVKSANKKAIDFYASRGFKIVAQGYLFLHLACQI